MLQPSSNQFTNVVGKFLPNVKEIFDNPHEVKKRRSMYVIYKWIDVIYYGDKDDENNISEKFEYLAEEEM